MLIALTPERLVFMALHDSKRTKPEGWRVEDLVRETKLSEDVVLDEVERLVRGVVVRVFRPITPLGAREPLRFVDR